MTQTIITIGEKKLAGKNLMMSLADNKTVELWKTFMPRRKEITSRLTEDLISMQVYPAMYFENFHPANEFEKWAAVEVGDFNNIPGDMETFLLPGGLYVVFDYKGSSTDNSIFQYIYGTWIPGSNYVLDDRPHFEILGGKYKTADPDSEEEIWIPIKPK